jgi:hypothetical protein
MKLEAKYQPQASAGVAYARHSAPANNGSFILMKHLPGVKKVAGSIPAVLSRHKLCITPHAAKCRYELSR